MIPWLVPFVSMYVYAMYRRVCVCVFISTWVTSQLRFIMCLPPFPMISICIQSAFSIQRQECFVRHAVREDTSLHFHFHFSILILLWYVRCHDLTPSYWVHCSGSLSRVYISWAPLLSGQATVLDARASRVKWPAQFMSHWYGILFTE